MTKPPPAKPAFEGAAEAGDCLCPDLLYDWGEFGYPLRPSGSTSLLGRLFILFVTVPFVELALLLWLSQVTDWRLTFALVVLTGIVGAILAKSQGLRAWQNVQQQMRNGNPPTEALLDAAMILVAGALLLTPGLLTDALGFSLLLPVGRRFHRRWLTAAFRRHVRFESYTPGSPGAGSPRQSQIIEAEVVSTNRD